MFRHLYQSLSFTSESQRILKAVQITPEQPLILPDFATLLAFVREQTPLVTKAGQLPMGSLTTLNARLTRTLVHNLKRPLQKSFPHIHGLYLLLRASGLTFIGGSDKKPQLLVDETLSQTWQQLKPVEQYGNLLETWFLRGKEEIIGEQGTRFDIPRHLTQVVRLFSEMPATGIFPTRDRDVQDNLRYFPGFYNLALMELFGFIQVTDGPPAPGSGWQIEQVQPTELGRAVLGLLWQDYVKRDDYFMSSDDRVVWPGVWQSLFQPYFPDWQHNLVLPTWTFRPGVYHFKVSLGSIWRRIALSADKTLDDLARIILRSVNFDNDHLYRFSYQNRFGAIEAIFHPYMDEGPFADEWAVGDLPVRVGQTFTYLFDFGDQWGFDVTLEEVDEAQTLDRPVILEAKGDAPPQYRRWDEDDSDW